MKNVKYYVDYKEQFIDEDGYLVDELPTYYEETCVCNLEKWPQTEKEWFDTYVEIAREYVFPMSADFGWDEQEEVEIMIENTEFDANEGEYVESKARDMWGLELEKYAKRVVKAAKANYVAEPTNELKKRPIDVVLTKNKYGGYNVELSKEISHNDYNTWWDIYYEIANRCWDDAKKKYRNEEKDGDFGEYMWTAVDEGLRYSDYDIVTNDRAVDDYMGMHEDDIEKIVFEIWSQIADERKLKLEGLTEIKEKVF